MPLILVIINYYENSIKLIQVKAISYDEEKFPFLIYLFKEE